MCVLDRALSHSLSRLMGGHMKIITLGMRSLFVDHSRVIFALAQGVVLYFGVACDEQGQRSGSDPLDMSISVTESERVDQRVDDPLFGDADIEDMNLTEPTPISSEPIADYDPVPLVDPFIATGGEYAEIASVSPGASAPNGMTLVGPDTRRGVMIPPFHCAGYHYPDTHIQGFSHTHAHGIGVVDYGGISLMPRREWSDSYRSFIGRQAPFSHDEEWASAGRYGVVLKDDQTMVDIVATPHGAHHRYLFTAGASPSVILDLGDNLETTETRESSLRYEGEGEISAYQRLDGSYSGRFGGVKHYAVLRLSPPPERVIAWSDEGEPEELEALSELNGRSVGLSMIFPEGTDEVHVRVALSFVDYEGARLNLEAELPDLDFERRVTDVERLWRNKLSRVKVRGTDREVARFTTAHYHSLLMPSLNSDVDGRYRGLDQEVHRADFDYYSDLSLWDTFRTLHSFYLLAHPELQRDMLRSLVRMYEDGGSLPRWPLAHGYTGGMVGTPATQLFAEAALKGIGGWNEESAYEAALAQTLGEASEATRGGGDSYLRLGWVPMEEVSGSVSRTLEFAWSDDALARWATLRDAEEAELLTQLSGSWRNHWDETQNFMVGRDAEGSFMTLESPLTWESVYVEGNAWHYLWYVPYDVEGMIDVQHDGDRAAFLSRLHNYWTEVYEEEDDYLPDDYYWHGNEPVLHYAWLGSLAGDHSLTVEASHHILETRYGHEPADGLDGNDDSGTLSAWYLFTTMGFYPIAGTADYALGAPLFERIEISGPSETQPPLVIEAVNSGWYRTPRVVFNEMNELERPVIDHPLDIIGYVL